VKFLNGELKNINRFVGLDFTFLICNQNS